MVCFLEHFIKVKEKDTWRKADADLDDNGYDNDGNESDDGFLEL